MSIDFQDDAERLVAQQAVLAWREVKHAMQTAEHGCGADAVEEAALAQSLEQARIMMEQAFSAHAGAQKGGPAVSVAAVASPPRSRATWARR